MTGITDREDWLDDDRQPPAELALRRAAAGR